MFNVQGIPGRYAGSGCVAHLNAHYAFSPARRQKNRHYTTHPSSCSNRLLGSHSVSLYRSVQTHKIGTSSEYVHIYTVNMNRTHNVRMLLYAHCPYTLLLLVFVSVQKKRIISANIDVDVEGERLRELECQRENAAGCLRFSTGVFVVV